MPTMIDPDPIAETRDGIRRLRLHGATIYACRHCRTPIRVVSAAYLPESCRGCGRGTWTLEGSCALTAGCGTARPAGDAAPRPLPRLRRERVAARGDGRPARRVMAVMLLARYEVADRDRFLEAFDGFEPARRRAGATAAGLVRSLDHSADAGRSDRVRLAGGRGGVRDEHGARAHPQGARA